MTFIGGIKYEIKWREDLLVEKKVGSLMFGWQEEKILLNFKNIIKNVLPTLFQVGSFWCDFGRFIRIWEILLFEELLWSV